MKSLELPTTLTRQERNAARRVGLSARRRFLWGGLFLAAIALAALISLYYYIDHS